MGGGPGNDLNRSFDCGSNSLSFGPVPLGAGPRCISNASLPYLLTFYNGRSLYKIQIKTNLLCKFNLNA